MDIGNRNNQSSGGIGANMLIPIVAFGLFILVGGVLISQLTPSLFPPTASAEAQNINELFRILLLIGGAIFLLVEGLIVFAVIRYRTSASDTSDGPNLHGNMTLEIVWTIIPAIIVIFLSIISFNIWTTNRTIKADENIVEGAPIAMRVIAQRYNWTFEYTTNRTDPNQDNNPVVFTSRNLYTYVGQNVHLQMETLDVIHSLWIPAMRMKQDVIPGRTTDFRFTPIAPENGEYAFTDAATGARWNEYSVVCTELCGDGHGAMGLIAKAVVFENEESYINYFYNIEVDKILNPPADPVLRGQAILASGKYPCQSCHTLSSLGWAGITGPNQNGIGVRASKRISGQIAEEYLVRSIYEPTAYTVAGFQSGAMPTFGPGALPSNAMSAEDLYAIVAYLCTETDGAESSCNLVDLTTTIPNVIQANYGLTVDPNFGSAGAEVTPEATAEVMGEPGAETTAEPDATPAPEATTEALPEATAESTPES